MAGYLYASSRVVAETDAAGNLIERFVYATRSNVPNYLVTCSGDAATGTYRIVSDHSGSVRLVIDALTGAIAERIDYDVWGNITADTDPGFQPFAFAGGLYDADTGLVHFSARDYEPEIGRWISFDPILFVGGDVSLYRSVVDDLVNSNDPGGLTGFENFLPGRGRPSARQAGAAARRFDYDSATGGGQVSSPGLAEAKKERNMPF